VRKLRISLAAKYFDEYVLCVKAPDQSQVCKPFDIEKTGSTYGDSVRWKRKFPNKGPGKYNVNWKSGGSIVGRAGFHI
jgi:hypothetical protein